ncbi:MAG: hypothetical protein A2381_19905 [Bdellovibrionales bacterium RIFOXYB1_FULL_37_110]|nr:MAG: hypothetical protein A2181_03540 [Bdellovibrionales bacterium RIFOXYA1_FULL_38_20]OFZ51002.1 MAG: hypothetical protein A2417_19690 [Bdellovibrionales bacterium RIFOXYC1_FULL_37_79]OFZ60214.1 MAG: hypothetical protein A2381_19905 [Bdellovibrionales bacterium RIFOXYB1_FULL_37_110]OFZ61576.1 MAG: hypothetical protein A2577_10345 [Bdellovibrionales bacterium RIFOXYD1_FULL_36_51]
MRSIISLLFLGIFLSSNANAVYLRSCSNLDTTFRICEAFVNINFSVVGRTLGQGILFGTCHNTSSKGVSKLYEQCINENFSRLADVLDDQVSFRHCMNLKKHKVSWEFVSCINENFDIVESELIDID